MSLAGASCSFFELRFLSTRAILSSWAIFTQSRSETGTRVVCRCNSLIYLSNSAISLIFSILIVHIFSWLNRWLYYNLNILILTDRTQRRFSILNHNRLLQLHSVRILFDLFRNVWLLQVCRLISVIGWFDPVGHNFLSLLNLINLLCDSLLLSLTPCLLNLRPFCSNFLISFSLPLQKSLGPEAILVESSWCIPCRDALAMALLFPSNESLVKASLWLLEHSLDPLLSTPPIVPLIVGQSNVFLNRLEQLGHSGVLRNIVNVTRLQANVAFFKLSY